MVENCTNCFYREFSKDTAFPCVTCAVVGQGIINRWVPLDMFTKPDATVNHPAHYKKHPSGIECIDITKHMGFNLGNVIKYIWRCDEKGKDIEDLKKALFYLKTEIKMRESINI